MEKKGSNKQFFNTFRMNKKVNKYLTIFGDSQDLFCITLNKKTFVHLFCLAFFVLLVKP